MLLASNLGLGGGTVGDLGASSWVRTPNVGLDDNLMWFGSAAASLGDLDEDGVPDVAVGSEDSVFILFMNTDGTVRNHRRFFGDRSFGQGLATGDMDGDGIVDIAIGERFDSRVGQLRGAVHLLLLNRDGTAKSTTTIASGLRGGPDLLDGDQFGSAVSVIGDLNDDGVSDLAVGAIGDDSGANAGALYILLMNADVTVKEFQKITGGNGSEPELSAGDAFVSSVASLGDLDGDGILDLVVGAQGDDTGATNAGAVYVLHMNSDGSVKGSTKIAGDVNGGPVDTVLFGSAVTAIDDVNGDGITDLVVGAELNESQGAVYTLFLNPDGTVKSSQKIANDSGGGPQLDHEDMFGSSVTHLGDLDGDGVGDVIVGARMDDTASTDRGAVYVLFMKSDGSVKHSQMIASDTNGGPSLGRAATFGDSVVSVGDLDGDGVEDLAVGAEGDDTLFRDQGAVFVMFMNADGSVKRFQKVSHQLGGGPTLSDSRFGSSVAPLGDLDGDGVLDLAVGARLDDTGGLNKGAVHVLFMNPDGTVNNSRKIANDTGGGPTLPASADFGRSIAMLGDLDGDGTVELAVGAPDARTVYILFMNSDGTVKKTATIDGTTEGLAIVAGSEFGKAVSATGDINGDGVEDLAVGAPGLPVAPPLGGAVHLLFMNSDGTVQSAKTIGSELGGGPTLEFFDTFGSSVAFLGDLDGDGIGDLSVGNPQRFNGVGPEWDGRGSVYILLLNADGTVKRFQKVDNEVGGGPSLDAGDHFGWSMSSGDFNGNGTADLIVGTPRHGGTVHVRLDIPTPPLEVLTVAPTTTGFEATFNGAFDVQSLDVGRSIFEQPTADVTLHSATTGVVSGSVVVDASSRVITFIKTGGPLVPAEYTVTLRSAVDGFRTEDGWLLDGNRDGIGGDDFSETFSIDTPPGESITVAMPDIVEGPGESFQLPISLSQGLGIRTVDLQISYNPADLAITSASVGPGMPTDASVELNLETPGVAALSFVSPIDLRFGPGTVIDLRATVPETATPAAQHVLDIHSIIAKDGLNNAVQVLDDDGLHLVGLRADVSGDGRVTASDASLVARVAALLERRFPSMKLTDPILIGDISGNGRINALDASLVARIAAGLDIAQTPFAASIEPNSVPSELSHRLGVIQTVTDLQGPALIRQETEAVQWRRAAVDRVMAGGYTLSRANDDEEDVLVLEDGLDENVSAILVAELPGPVS